MPIEPEDYLNIYYLTALSLGSNNNYSEIGSAEIIVVDPFVEESVYDMCESYSIDLLTLYRTMYDKEERLFRPPLAGESQARQIPVGMAA